MKKIFTQIIFMALAFPCVATALPIDGFIVYHNYSNYDAWDARLFMYNFSTQTKTDISTSWNIDHEMNAHISPDGSHIVFMGDNSGLPHDWDIYLWQINSDKMPVNLTSGNNLRDEDPKFSPDGLNIVFKQNGDIKIMDLTGTIIKNVTNDGYIIEESMPYYTADGQEIVYAKGAGAGSDIYSVKLDGSNKTALYSQASISEYYPIIKDNTSLFYTAWLSTANTNDQIFLGDFSNKSEHLSINDPKANNSDAAPVGTDYLFFSSTRSGGHGGYDLYFGQISTGLVWSLNDINLNSDIEDLGTCYYKSKTTTGIHDFSISKIVYISPNPTTGIVNYQLGIAGEHQVFLYDMMGRLVFNEAATEVKPISVSHLNKGVYQFEILQGNKRLIEKLIIE